MVGPQADQVLGTHQTLYAWPGGNVKMSAAKAAWHPVGPECGPICSADEAAWQGTEWGGVDTAGGFPYTIASKAVSHYAPCSLSPIWTAKCLQPLSSAYSQPLSSLP